MKYVIIFFMSIAISATGCWDNNMCVPVCKAVTPKASKFYGSEGASYAGKGCLCTFIVPIAPAQAEAQTQTITKE